MKIDRLISIIMVLMEKKRITARDLADMFDVSQRTIYRDIETINLSGIPVSSSSGVGGGFEIMSGYKIDKKLLSTSDFVSILMGLDSVSSMVSGDEIVNTLAKIKSLIPEERAKEIELKSNQVFIDLQPWMCNENLQLYLKIVKNAIQAQNIVSFSYIDRNNNTSSRKIEPYQLVLKDNQWYIRGYCYERQDFRLFKISRISNLQILTETFILRDIPDTLSEFSIEMARKQIDIKLRVHKSILDRVLEYYRDEEMMEEDDDHYIIHFPFVDDDHGYNLLFGFGDKCECLEPEKIRLEMKQRIKNLSSLYNI